MGFATNIFFPQGVIGIGIELLGILALSILRKLKNTSNQLYPSTKYSKRTLSKAIDRGWIRQRKSREDN